MTGLHEKYIVHRVDGQDKQGCKHENCRLFVLDLDHDMIARIAAMAYADHCQHDNPELAEDIRNLVAEVLVSEHS